MTKYQAVELDDLQADRIEVGSGRVVSVDIGADHHFVDVTEDLSVLVVFAPAATPQD
jgi:hypothetical protein